MDEDSLKEEMVRKGFWQKIRRHLLRNAFFREVLAAYYCAFDNQTPILVKATLIGALAYFILPTDVIPDFILGLGFTDDAAVLYTAIRSVRNHIKNRHRRMAQEKLDELLGD